MGCFINAFRLCFHQIDKIYWYCMSSFTANFQGLELLSSPPPLQKLLNLEKLWYYLRMQKQKLNEFRVSTNISCSIIMEKEQYCENSKGQCLHVQYIPVFIYVRNLFFPSLVTIALMNI